jgi:hypothetical protein
MAVDRATGMGRLPVDGFPPMADLEPAYWGHAHVLFTSPSSRERTSGTWPPSAKPGFVSPSRAPRLYALRRVPTIEPANHSRITVHHAPALSLPANSGPARESAQLLGWGLRVNPLR